MYCICCIYGDNILIYKYRVYKEREREREREKDRERMCVYVRVIHIYIYRRFPGERARSQRGNIKHVNLGRPGEIQRGTRSKPPLLGLEGPHLDLNLELIVRPHRQSC